MIHISVAWLRTRQDTDEPIKEMSVMSNEMNTTNGNSYLKGALIGAVIGAAAALLFAPKSGRELRQDIKVKASEAGDVIKTAANTISDTACDCAHTVGHQASQIKEKVQSMTDSLRSRAANKAADVQEDIAEAADAARDLTERAAEHTEQVIDAVEEKSKNLLEQS